MPKPTVDIGWIHLALASALVLVAVALSEFQRLGLARRLLIGALRAVVQLTLIGYLLVWLFHTDHAIFVLGVLLVMGVTATFAATGRQPGGAAMQRRLRPICFVSILVGSGLTIAYVSAIVVDITPWYNPRYLIPLFGMIVGNAMNGAALAAERLRSEMEHTRAQIEALLALGASPQQASTEPARRAIVAAMIPTINSLTVVGVVSLPGMMTGQILAGSAPTLAVRYQLVVVFMLVGATSITATGIVRWYRRTFFTPAAQLLPRVPV
ncbi:MAG: iron export ABC transporter permease subunit FetB [Gammaproteobacteria bacterium]|nr:iron export ABC transporter permease subunit FetB [Gammaproteobacteria bacterium]